jgi:hypothetical protein
MHSASRLARPVPLPAGTLFSDEQLGMTAPGAPGVSPDDDVTKMFCLLGYRGTHEMYQGSLPEPPVFFSR